MTAGNRVSVVCCAAFGKRLRNIDLSHPIWIVRSDGNNPIIAEFRRAKKGDITDFDSEPFADLMETINEHHWKWVELKVYGVDGDEIESVLTKYGSCTLTRIEGGFVCSRSAP